MNVDSDPILTVHHLKKYFTIKTGQIGRRVSTNIHSVEDISFNIHRGETLGIVGESGCGKSTTARMIIRLLEPTSGEINFEGENLLEKSRHEMRKIRKDIQMVFQDPFESLDPRMKISAILEEPMKNFNLYNRKQRKQRVADLLKEVGLSSAYADRYPNEFSGGQRQRIGIARALASHPKLLIADEPVSALDVSVQSQVLNLMKGLQKKLDLTYLFISHDLSVVKHFCDRIAVMYLGRIVELSEAEQLFKHPRHPYTQSLISAIPIPRPNTDKKRIILQGEVPDPSNPPEGCPFHTRCPVAMEICSKSLPEFINKGNEHFVACHIAT
ncbi:ABC transporter ATP-binding protein [Sporolactobacillus vineae]|uniref:ABC transporter ATP-binding protein n=1 Tax=Sporolactobacillus vineae TaxID=444463 RepID=UPI000289ED2A|nr:dipeptide ABC transporter ATP-binding protein [Sporolactobacillus vineae]